MKTKAVTTIPSSEDNYGKPAVKPQTLVAAILVYIFVSLAIVYYNYILFTLLFPFPVFISWIQQPFGVLIFYIFGFAGKFIPIFSRFPTQAPKLRTLKTVLPLTATFVGMVSLANLCLQYVQISTYQVARSLTLMFTVGLSYMLLAESQTTQILLAVTVTTVGFIVGSLDPTTLSLRGVLAGSFSSVFQALYNVVLKRVLRSVDDDVEGVLLHNMIISTIMFLPVIYLAREHSAFALLPWDPTILHFWEVWGSLFLSAVLSASLNLVCYLCVSMTSPLTFTIVGGAKACVQSLGGIIVFGDSVTFKSIAGIFLSMAGSLWYSVAKVRASKVEVSKVAEVSEGEKEKLDESSGLV